MTVQALVKTKQSMKRHAVYIPETLFNEVMNVAAEKGISFNSAMTQFAQWGVEQERKSVA